MRLSRCIHMRPVDSWASGGTGVEMDRRPPAIFVGDARGLDFLNTVATPVDRIIDWIDDGQGLASWLAQAGLAPVDALSKLKMRALPGELDNVADQARGLREWFRGFVRRHMGRPLKAESLAELAPLNGLLERDEFYSQIAAAPSGKAPLDLLTLRRWRNPDSLLPPLGAALAQLVCEEDFTHVKACEGPACTLLFVDRTRGHARRWCSMAICGNRAKQAAYRLRLRAQREDSPDV